MRGANWRANVTIATSILLNDHLPNLDAALADKAHAGIANGVVHVDGFTAAAGAPVTNGLFNLFVNDGQLNDAKCCMHSPSVWQRRQTLFARRLQGRQGPRQFRCMGRYQYALYSH